LESPLVRCLVAFGKGANCGGLNRHLLGVISAKPFHRDIMLGPQPCLIGFELQGVLVSY
jgi:hypothetical protein